MRRPLLIAVAGLAFAGCSNGSETDQAEIDETAGRLATRETPSPLTEPIASVADPTSAPVADPTTAPDDPVTTAGAAEVCPAGESPSVGAFDLDTGALLWSGCSEVAAYREIYGAGDGVVVLSETSPSGEFAIALDSADGTELWRQAVYPQLDTPTGAVNDSVVVIETAIETPPFVTGVDPRTGQELWRLASGTSLIAASDDVVVTANASRYEQRTGGGIFGIDRATGAEIWSNPARFEGNPSGGGPAAITDGVVAVPTGGTVTGIDVATGESVWTGAGLDSTVGSDGVFVGGKPTGGPASEIRAIAVEDGTTLWTVPGTASYGGILAVGDGVAAVLDEGAHVAYELATGAERWRTEQSQLAPRGEPQLIVGTSLVLLWESFLEVASTTDGNTTWSSTQPLNSPWMNSVGANDTTVFVAVNSVPFGD